MQNTKEPHRIHNPTSPCSCHVRHFNKVLDGKTYLAEKIVYCPIHAAAPELLEALKLLFNEVTTYTYGECFPDFSGNDSDYALAAWDKARAAITKAIGGQQ